MTASVIELSAWAKTLTQDQLAAALNEMRRRGAAIAIYDAAEIRTMYDGHSFTVQPEDWLSYQNRAYVEETMCEAAREIFQQELSPTAKART